MKFKDVISVIQMVLDGLSAKRASGKFIIVVNMSQGGFGEPKCYATIKAGQEQALFITSKGIEIMDKQ